jgi:hypothetical protein
LPFSNKAFRRGSQTTSFVTWGFKRPYNQAAQVPSFKRDLHLSAESIKKLQTGVGLRLDNTLHHNFAGSIPDRHRNAFLVMPLAALQGTCRLPDYADSRQVTFSASRLAQDSLL